MKTNVIFKMAVVVVGIPATMWLGLGHLEKGDWFGVTLAVAAFIAFCVLSFECEVQLRQSATEDKKARARARGLFLPALLVGMMTMSAQADVLTDLQTAKSEFKAQTETIKSTKVVDKEWMVGFLKGKLAEAKTSAEETKAKVTALVEEAKVKVPELAVSAGEAAQARLELQAAAYNKAAEAVSLTTEAIKEVTK